MHPVSQRAADSTTLVLANGHCDPATKPSGPQSTAASTTWLLEGTRGPSTTPPKPQNTAAPNILALGTGHRPSHRDPIHNASNSKEYNRFHHLRVGNTSIHNAFKATGYRCLQHFGVGDPSLGGQCDTCLHESTAIDSFVVLGLRHK